jgi:hypothetical protein
MSHNEWAWEEPEYCPLCGRSVEKPDDNDPELLVCEKHGRLHVEVLSE